MAELTRADVYTPRSMQVWRALLNWLAFFVQIFAQIIRAVGQYPLLSSSSSSSTTTETPTSAHRFKRLPVVESTEIESPATVEIAAVLDSPVPAGGVRVEKLTVVLDLDETLVCAYETSSLPPALRNQATDAGLKWFELECVSSDKEFEGKPKISYVTVFERPGLQEFLNQLSEFAELVLFTAGLEGYARPLVDRIDKENRFSLRLYRPSTICTEYREHVKDLSCLSKNLCQTVIVDNNPFSFLLQPLNGIPCIPFSAGQPHDTQLLDVLLPLLKHLSLQKDVRPFLYDRFHMPEWFQKQGIPASGWSV
ncbi:hypothetical protein F3Y22_tig00110704pilonHSYRG00061 [Hibiscus syriacus]|uniref:FCP1 homology domain-containing protein n=1 Tax=Hibiscus syriacus TaxID=106335 RepID=A0A6A2ZWU4_HIBSY|nr:carboxy-terminal domain RNA polymerase II polypeptide A small phosphatase 1-like [Hibiscus syriacus]KAE8695602.1 hypothetical protein F3Y22_tig00110704pilonHSYRG00061 [Hibiscus syriacus]